MRKPCPNCTDGWHYLYDKEYGWSETKCNTCNGDGYLEVTE